MRALVQRVLSASVRVEGSLVGAIGPGLLVFAGFRGSDDEAVLDWMAKKLVQLRIFSDAEGKMNLSVADAGGGVLIVSQFTLYGDARKGNRPSFIDAAAPSMAEPCYEQFCRTVERVLGKPVARGRFGADMKIELINDGPVTLWLEREAGANPTAPEG